MSSPIRRSAMAGKKHKAPSLESLVNQCCEDYYFKLNQTLEHINKDQTDTYFSYEKFREYIQSSHCQENLKFLIEIYHYEKIWNKIFKRQSSILKCKDETMSQHSHTGQGRKHSVATIITNASSRKRHPSIIELPENEDVHSSSLRTPDEKQRMDSIHSLDNNDITNLVDELTIPKVISTHDDIDTRSFLETEEGPLSSTAVDTTLTEDDDDPLSGTRPLQHTHTQSSQRTNSNWDTLFKPGYQCDDTHACLCNVPSHEHKHISVSPEEEEEYNESVKQMEIREQLKEELSQKFEYIITYYVLSNSPYEINLPSDVYKDLMKEYENTKILYHSPLTLLPAKNAVLQLLRENIYYKFLSEQERLITREESHKIIQESAASTITTTSLPPPSPITISRDPETRSSSNNTDFLSKDLKSLHIDTSTSVGSTGSGAISSISQFFKHKKQHQNNSEDTINRTHTFGGLKSPSDSSVTTSRHSVCETSPSDSINTENGHHGWSKLLRFKKKKNAA